MFSEKFQTHTNFPTYPSYQSIQFSFISSLFDYFLIFLHHHHQSLCRLFFGYNEKISTNDTHFPSMLVFLSFSFLHLCYSFCKLIYRDLFCHKLLSISISHSLFPFHTQTHTLSFYMCINIF